METVVITLETRWNAGYLSWNSAIVEINFLSTQVIWRANEEQRSKNINTCIDKLSKTKGKKRIAFALHLKCN